MSELAMNSTKTCIKLRAIYLHTITIRDVQINYRFENIYQVRDEFIYIL
jgi:hypothetical protein